MLLIFQAQQGFHSGYSFNKIRQIGVTQIIRSHCVFSSGRCRLKKRLFLGCLNEVQPFSLQRARYFCRLPIVKNDVSLLNVYE